MATQLSTGLVSRLMDTAALKDILDGFVIDIYTGAQPASADSAASGTLLATITSGGGAYTASTSATGSVTLATGAAGSVDTVTVNAIDILGGAVAFNTDLTTTAADVATQINRNPRNLLYRATSSGAVVTITAAQSLGALPNTWVVAATSTTITTTTANMSGGVTSVNGLHFEPVSSGAINKRASDVWQGTAVASGTAGWFRIRGNGDTGAGATTTAVRWDGAISTSGAQMNLGSLTVTAGAPFVIATAAFSLPQA